ncbi:MAG: serine hydrolase domain-containing protein [Pseudomonadales bacterium]|jgi:CubicO group peptidase (beta-lactamase class C family)|nr:serine hydrolase domain-containing protein [Kiritimatiellia bacterium]MDP6971703.1 serine hydrolase domain-containing protein [Pseudomonadales bacterium]
MKRLILLCGLLGLIQNAWALDINNHEAVEAFIDGAVKPVMRKSYSPSGVVMVMKDGEVILNKGYGYQDLEAQIPVDPYNSLFRPGSISKLFTWIAVLQQEEQGKVDLDTDVNEYLTQFQVEDSWPGQPVTLRHILTHTGGFEDGALGYLIIDDPGRIIPLAEALERYQPRRVNPPGAHTSYSNWGTALAGLIVANVSGTEFNQYVQQHIFDVLGMEKASFEEPLPPELDALMVKHYGLQDGLYVEKPYEIIANFGPAGALAASTGAMEKFARALLNGGEYNGGRILRAATVERFLAREFSHDARTRGMGLGAIHYPYNGIDVVGHDGGTTTFVSHFGLAREHDLMFYASFSGPGAASIIYEHLVWPFYDEFFNSERAELTPPADFTERGGKYVGTYHTWRGSFSKVESLLRMAMGREVTMTPDGTLMIAGREFVEEDVNLFRERDGETRYAFQEDAQGNVTGMIQDGFAVMQFYKAPAYAGARFAGPLLALSFIVFAGVFLRWGYQRKQVQSLPQPERRAFNASIYVAAANWVFLIVMGLALMLNADTLMYEIPGLLKFSLVFPMLAVIAALYHLFQSYQVWSGGLCGSVWTRARYSVITLCALFTAWFYWYWNLVGFNYHS